MVQSLSALLSQPPAASGGGHAAPVPGPAQADGSPRVPSGTPRAVLNIKRPGKPKYVCHYIPLTILLHAGEQDFKLECILNQVYAMYIPGI